MCPIESSRPAGAYPAGPGVFRWPATVAAFALASAPGVAAGLADMHNITGPEFTLVFHEGALTGLRRVNDAFDTEYLLAGARFGDLTLGYRRAGDAGDWVRVNTAEFIRQEPARVRVEAGTNDYGATLDLGPTAAPEVQVVSRFTHDGAALHWDLTLRNLAPHAMEIGDLGLPFPMNSKFVWDREQTYTQGVFRHVWISGHASFLFWMRCNSVGPYLLFTPAGGGAKFEYFDTAGGRVMRPYVHAAGQAALLREKGTRWRQPLTALTLAPRGEAGHEHTYRFKFQWARDYEDIRNRLVAEGLMDVHVIPGMTVPLDLAARFALRTRQPVQAVEPEFPDATRVTPLDARTPDTRLYEVRFTRLGENKLTVRYGDGRAMVLEFFVTEPVETLIRKRSAFLAAGQIRDPSKWYNGLITDWNMQSHVRLTPDQHDRIKGWRIYMITCDDPGLCKPPFMAAKNVEYPDAREIEALDHYIRHFVWGGLQRTTAETHPYAIYGIPDWKTNRESPDPGTRGRKHYWRVYDYPHIVALYFRMYQVAKFHPGIPTALKAGEYLTRAFGTARALFTIPKEVEGWSADATGFYNELVIEEVIAALEEEGRTAEAAELRAHWERKVKFFVQDKPSLFGSEYPFDSTGFESTAALARYALLHAADGGGRTGGPGFDVTTAQARAFLETQLQANLLCRGWLETAYYLLGSDFRSSGMTHYTLSYMSQMGGWGVMDYALHRTAETPHALLRLAYASYLSSWALMNTGTPESNFGYWFPGKENDGGAGGGFEPAPYGHTWLEQPHCRGAWYYGCEIDLGYAGALRTANTVLTDDPIFGLVALGGVLDAGAEPEGVGVIPRDGIRRRFHVRRGERKLDLVLERDHFTPEQPIRVRHDLSVIRFQVDAAGGSDHVTRLTVGHLAPGPWRLLRDGTELASFTAVAGRETRLDMPLKAGERAAAFELRR